MNTRAALVAAFFFAAAPAALGWGADGHRIVGDIAWHYLSPEAKRQVVLLMKDDRYRTLAETATWPDTYARSKRRYEWLEPYHYINIDADAQGDSVVDVRRQCPEQNGKRACVVEGIHRWTRVLQDPDASKREQVFALRMVSHLVGDVHQPLHVAHSDGRGGNRTDVLFFGENRTLHSVWDTGLIRRHLQATGDAEPEWEADSRPGGWKEFANEIRAEITPGDVEAWADGSVEAWANESFRYAKILTFDILDGESLARPYFDKAFPVVRLRLQQAGIRLAAVLNDVYK